MLSGLFLQFLSKTQTIVNFLCTFLQLKIFTSLRQMPLIPKSPEDVSYCFWKNRRNSTKKKSPVFAELLLFRNQNKINKLWTLIVGAAHLLGGKFWVNHRNSITIFCRKFCLKIVKSFAGQAFGLCESSWYRNMWCIEASIKMISQKLMHQCTEKFRDWALWCFWELHVFAFTVQACCKIALKNELVDMSITY